MTDGWIEVNCIACYLLISPHILFAPVTADRDFECEQQIRATDPRLDSASDWQWQSASVQLEKFAEIGMTAR